MTHSPWGKIQDTVKLCHGVSVVHTPGHGGIRATRRFAEKRLSEEAVKRAIKYGSHLWWEEDCDYAIPLWELPDLWPPANVSRQSLFYSLSRWNPDYLNARGDTPDPALAAEWQAMQEDDKRRVAKDPDLITAASRIDRETTRVWTADGEQHTVTAGSYAERHTRRLNLLSACVTVD